MLPFTRVSAPYWDGRTVWIIGGGPSIRPLSAQVVARWAGIKVGVNRSAWDFDCDALVSLDQHFVATHRAKVEEFQGEKYLCAYLSANLEPVKGAHYLHRFLSTRGLSRAPDKIAGRNSGFAAINVAYLKRAREIRLLGFDMRHAPRGRTHYHAGYRWHSGCDMSQWAAEIDSLSDQLRGVRVINYIGEPESLIRGYERRPLNELLR